MADDWIKDMRNRVRFTISRPLWKDGPMQLVAVSGTEWNLLLDVVENHEAIVEKLRALKEVNA